MIRPVVKLIIMIYLLNMFMLTTTADAKMELVEIPFPGQIIDAITVHPAQPEYGWIIAQGVLLETRDGFSSLHLVETVRKKTFKFVIINPDTPVTVFAGGKDGLWKCDSQRENWRLVLKQPIISMAQAEGGYLWVAGDDKGTFDPDGKWCVYHSTDYGERWNQIYQSSSEHDFTRGLVVDSKYLNRLWSGGWYGLWRSEDGGRSWEWKDDTERIYSLLFDSERGELFLGYGNTGIARLVNNRIKPTALTDKRIDEMAFMGKDKIVALGSGEDTLYILDTNNNNYKPIISFKKAVTSFALIPVLGGWKAIIGGDQAIWRIKLMDSEPPPTTGQRKSLPVTETNYKTRHWLLVGIMVVILGGLGIKFFRRKNIFSRH